MSVITQPDSVRTDATDSHSSTDAPKAYKPRVLAFVLLGIILLVASIFMVGYWIENQPVRQPRPQVTELSFVEVIPVTLGDNAVLIRANGFVSAKETASISPQVSGKIIHIAPQLLVGESIPKGKTLVQLDRTDYQAALATATANLATAESNYQQEQGKSRQAARDVKRLGVKATTLNLRKPQLAAAKAAVDNAKAQLTLAKTNLQRTTITAPFNGVVQTTAVALGQIANANSVLATFAATDTYTVKLTLSSRDLQLLRIGDSVTLSDSVYSNTRTGQLNRFDAAFDTQNRTIGAYVDIDKPLSGEQPLRLASYLTATITGKRIADSMWLANSAIVENRYVWRKNSDDTINQTAVNVIYRGHEQSLVTFDTTVTAVITRPKDNFADGETVTTKKTVSPRGQRKEKAAGKPAETAGEKAKQPMQPNQSKQPKQPARQEKNTRPTQKKADNNVGNNSNSKLIAGVRYG